MWLVFYILICVIYICAEITPADKTIKIVHLISRHGFRTPVRSYKNDPHKNIHWPEGYGGLVNEGKRQLYELGTNLHKRYEIFFKEENFQSNMIYVRSSHFERNYMSAATFMAGFYPPIKRWHPDINWFPTPIRITDREHDWLMLLSAPCPLYDTEKTKFMNSKEQQEKENQFKNLYRYITQMTGVKINNSRDIFFLYRTLVVEEQHGLKLPNWLKDIYPNLLHSIAVQGIELNTGTNLLSRLKVGFLIKEVINIIKEKQKNLLSPSIFVYSAQDSTIINLLNALAISDHILPDYGATVSIEGHWTSINKTEIRIYYFKNYAVKNPVQLLMPDCQPPCLLNDFVMIFDAVIPKYHRNIECAIKEDLGN